MQKKISITIFIIFGILVFVSLTKYAGWANILADLKDLQPWQWGIAVILNLGAVFLGSLKWKMILEEKDITTRYYDLVRAYLVSNMVYFFAPMLGFFGEISKAYFVRTQPEKKPAELFPSILIDKTFLWLINSLAVFFSFVYFLAKAHLWSNVLYIVSILGVLAALYYLGVKYKVIITEEGDNPHPQKLVEKLFLELKYFFEFFHNKNNLARIFPVAILEMSCTVAQTGFIVAFLLERAIVPWQAILIIGCIYMANLALMPAGLGTTEAAAVVAFSALSFSGKAALSYAIALRLVELTGALLGVLALFSLGVQKTKEIFKQSGYGS